MSTQPHYAVPFPIPEANTDHIKRKMFDLPYAHSSPAQKLDIYWPEEGNGPFPVVISIHGGAFMGGISVTFKSNPCLKCSSTIMFW